jgi:hypothetical protein
MPATQRNTFSKDQAAMIKATGKTAQELGYIRPDYPRRKGDVVYVKIKPA